MVNFISQINSSKEIIMRFKEINNTEILKRCFICEVTDPGKISMITHRIFGDEYITELVTNVVNK